MSFFFNPQLAQRLPLRILLVEDVAVNRKVALHLLKRLGYFADVASNGQEALDVLHDQPYDLVFMDVQMPEMDGLEATRRICQEWLSPQRPWIVAMTANALRGDRETCLRAGMNDYISKPIRVEALVQALSTYEQYKQQTSVVQELNFIHPVVASQGELTQQMTSHLTASPALNTQELQALKKMVGEDADFLVRLFDCYLEEAQQQLQAMGDAIAQGDVITLQKLAHSLKSISASIGATPLAQMCQALEVMGHRDRTSDASRLISQLHAEYDQVKAALHLEYPRRQ